MSGYRRACGYIRIEKVYVLFEIDYVTKAKNMRDRIVERAREVAAR